MTLLSILTDVADEVGVPRSSTVVSSTDQTVRTLFRLINKEGKELARRYDWQAIVKEKTFTSLAQESQTAMIPSDLKTFVNETFFNRTRKRPLIGPLTSREWQVQKSITASVYTDSFRVRGDAILITPTPTAGDTLAYEYVSKWWCTVSGGTTPTKDAFSIDTDIALLDEELITLGVIWRWKKAKGFDYSEDFRTYEIAVAQAITRDGSRRTLNMGRDGSRGRVPGIIVPEGSWSL